jgi:hypothetical protein
MPNNFEHRSVERIPVIDERYGFRGGPGFPSPDCCRWRGKSRAVMTPGSTGYAVAGAASANKELLQAIDGVHDALELGPI